MNKAILMGRLTKEPELKYTQNNLEICNFTLAVNRRFTKESSDVKADFIPIVCFGKTATFCAKYFQKGKQVAVCGRIQTSSWEKDGKRNYRTDIIADDVYFADGKGSSNNSNNNSSNNNSNTQNNNTNNDFSIDGNDDELPF